MPEVKNIEGQVRVESNMYNQGTANAQLIHEILNSATNWAPLVNKLKSGIAKDISDEPKVKNNKNCFILGSGPSLDKSIQYLKDWEGGIICTPSHALTLMYYNIEPTYILILDPFSRYMELEGIDWSKTKTKLIIHPGVNPDIISNWPNEILLYLQNAGRADSFYANEQRKMYSWRETEDTRATTFHFYIKTELTIFACSPPMQLFAGQLLGYEKFYLAGCDFAYLDNKERFTSYTIKNKTGGYYSNTQLIKTEKNDTDIIEWEKHEFPLNLENKYLVKTNNNLYSEAIHIYYLKNLISAWRLCEKTIYTTDKGAIQDIPFHDIKAVIKNNGNYPLQSKGFIHNICDKYLASVGAFVIETEKGNSFIESNNPEKDLLEFMNKVKMRYVCDECLVELNAPDLKSYNGDICPACNKGHIYQKINIDIEGNMNRIRKYLPKIEIIDSKPISLIPTPEDKMADALINNLMAKK